MKKISFALIVALLSLNCLFVHADKKILASPENLALLAKNSTAVTISWTAVEKFDGFAGYKIYDNDKLVGTSIKEGVNGMKSYYVITGLKPSSVHIYRVSVYDVNGNESRKSSPLIVKTTNGFERENVALGCKVAASSEVSADYTVRRIVDGSTSPIGSEVGDMFNIWRSSRKNTSEWVQLDLGKPTYIDSILIKHIGTLGVSLSLQNIKNYQILASNDKENWELLFDVKNNMSKITNYKLKESKLYRFVKIDISGIDGYNRATGNAALCADISEVEIYNDITKKPTQEELSKITYLDIPDIGYEMPRRNPPAIAYAMYAENKIAIDGVADDIVWQKSESYQVKKPLEAESPSDVWFKTSWNEENLYVFVDVKDANLFKDSQNIWDDDSIEIFIDTLNNKSSTYLEDDGKVTTLLSGEIVTKKIGTVSVKEPDVNTGIERACKITDNGWTLEIAIPMSFFNTSINEDSIMGFSVGYNDDNDGSSRDGHIIWEGRANSSNNTQNFGTLYFKREGGQ